MRLKILRNLSSAQFKDTPFQEGEVREVESAVADELIKQSLAVETDEPLTPIDHKTGLKKAAAPAVATTTPANAPAHTPKPSEPK